VILDLFGFSAVLISFGNLMDRRTSLDLDLKNFSLQNGLGKVGLGWGEIERVQATDLMHKRVVSKQNEITL